MRDDTEREKGKAIDYMGQRSEFVKSDKLWKCASYGWVIWN